MDDGPLRRIPLPTSLHGDEDGPMTAKMTTAEIFMTHHLPQVEALARSIGVMISFGLDPDQL